jgi:hypothetical protein
MLADLYAIEQQNRDVEPVATYQIGVTTYIDDLAGRQCKHRTQVIKVGCKRVAQPAVTPRQQLQKGQCYSGRTASAMALAVAGGTSPTAVTR